jgi:hypothetical protein
VHPVRIYTLEYSLLLYHYVLTDVCVSFWHPASCYVADYNKVCANLFVFAKYVVHTGASSHYLAANTLFKFHVLLTVHLGIIFVNNQLDAQLFFMYVYFYSLRVSGSHVPIIRRIKCINTTYGICHSE